MSEVNVIPEGQKEAEREVDHFRNEHGPFVVADQTTRVPMLFTNAKDPDNPIVFANDSLLVLWAGADAQVTSKASDFFRKMDSFYGPML